MKKFILTVLPLVALLILGGCKDDSDNGVAEYYDLTIAVTYPEGYTADNILSASVKAVNQQTSQTYEAVSIGDGKYKASVTAGEYNILLNMTTNKDAIINGVLQGMSVYNTATATVPTEVALIGTLVFKEVYYSMVKKGGKTPYNNDQFFEIYNNSASTVYLDNCVLGRLEGSQGVIPTRWVDAKGDILKKYPLSAYVPAFVGTTGSGKEFPLEAGQSVVIAFQAQDHRSLCPESPVNLTNADYEVYIGDYSTGALRNPDVPTLTILTKIEQATPKFFGLPYTGNAVIFAKFPDDVNLASYVADAANYMTVPNQTASTTEYLMIPQEYVMDGINVVNSNETKRVIRLRPAVDGGSVNNSEDYNGKSIRRKVKEIAPDGRVIFQDTNNSSEDFLTDQDPTPGVIPTIVD